VITFVIAAGKRKPQSHLRKRLPGMVRFVTYDRLFASSRVRRGTWIFTDQDRLGFWDLELAARYWRALAQGGARVLNDPARFLPRASLLKKLHREGLNSFRAWRLADGEVPDVFPVFLRKEAAHRGAATGLLNSSDEVATALIKLMNDGIPIRDIVAVEYRARELEDKPGAFRKYSMYVVGDRVVPAPIVTDVAWHAKIGTIGTATEEHYLFERRYNEERPHADHLRRAFASAGLEYGRADYTVIDDKADIYEINTNPTIGRLRKHHSQTRMETLRQGLDELVEAVAALDTPARGSIKLALDLPRRARPFFMRFQFSRWTP
jgi:hypothetical protein